MAGNRSAENGDFVTPRKLYRSDVTQEADDPTSGAVEILDTRYKDQNYDQNVHSFYGRNAQISVFAFLRDTATAATLKLYVKADIEKADARAANEESSSSSSSSGAANDWVLVETKAITESLLWVIKDVPPAQYKILCTSLTGGGSVELRTSHAA